jgi:hypothetical protein
MNSTTTKEKRTITLTGRPPIRIVVADWPVLADASGDSWRDRGDQARYDQARHRGELDTYLLRVRQHADGRVVSQFE